MAIHQAGADRSFHRPLLAGGQVHVSRAREPAPGPGDPKSQSETIEAMLDAFDQARGALENLANLVTISARRPGQWRCEPATDAARDSLWRSQRRALQLADQVLGGSQGGRAG